MTASELKKEKKTKERERLTTEREGRLELRKILRESFWVTTAERFLMEKREMKGGRSDG